MSTSAPQEISATLDSAISSPTTEKSRKPKAHGSPRRALSGSRHRQPIRRCHRHSSSGLSARSQRLDDRTKCLLSIKDTCFLRRIGARQATASSVTVHHARKPCRPVAYGGGIYATMQCRLRLISQTVHLSRRQHLAIWPPNKRILHGHVLSEFLSCLQASQRCRCAMEMRVFPSAVFGPVDLPP